MMSDNFPPAEATWEQRWIILLSSSTVCSIQLRSFHPFVILPSPVRDYPWFPSLRQLVARSVSHCIGRQLVLPDYRREALRSDAVQTIVQRSLTLLRKMPGPRPAQGVWRFTFDRSSKMCAVALAIV